MKKNNDRKFHIEDTIFARAKQSFPLTLTADNFQKWYDHWIDTTNTLLREFKDEGLTSSVAYVENLINDNLKWIAINKNSVLLRPHLEAFVKELNDTNRMGGPAFDRYRKAKQDLQAAQYQSIPA